MEQEPEGAARLCFISEERAEKTGDTLPPPYLTLPLGTCCAAPPDA